MACLRSCGIPVRILLPVFAMSVLMATKASSDEVHYHVFAVDEGRAELPCDLTVPTIRSRITIVLWYKDGVGLPIYSLDLRGENAVNGSHLISDTNSLGSRARFYFEDRPAILVLNPVKTMDAGVYRCRVDFHRAPTRNQKARLSVIDPPKYVSIVNSTGGAVSDVLLVKQDSTVELTCQTDSGSPVPQVTWWKGPSQLTGVRDVTPDGFFRSRLIIDNISRQHLHSTYTCQASNNNISLPVSKTVTLDVILRPLDVRILVPKEPLSANRERDIECESFGSRPSAIMSWWKGTKRLKMMTKEFFKDDKNITISVLTLKATEDDDGKYLTCRVDNPFINASTKENSWKMNVQFSPTATLQLSSKLTVEKLKENDDIIFECSIRANPRVYKVDWTFQGKMIRENVTGGVFFSNQSLVLRNVGRSAIGGYTCIARNAEGDGQSNLVNLTLKYRPYCKVGQKTLYGIAKYESALITCEVVAVPPAHQFKWVFNHTSKHLAPPPKINSSNPVITYTPRSEFDYGLLSCWAANNVGEQRVPCVFSIIGAGPPNPVFNCSRHNETESSVLVECAEGFDGGLEQHFVIEVYEAGSNQLKYNTTNSVPEFRVQDLDAGRRFLIMVYAANSKGTSAVFTMEANTLRVAERRTDVPMIFTMTPFLGILIGIVVALILIAVAIVIVMRLKEPDDDKKEEVGHTDTVDRASTPLKKEMEELDTLEEKNPDIVPADEDHLYDDVQDKVVANQKLNNTSERIYENVPGFNAVHREYENLKNVRNRAANKHKQPDDVMYAELQLPNNHRPTNMVRRATEPTVYAQIDHNRKVPRVASVEYDDEFVAASAVGADTPLMNNHRESTV